MLEGKEKKEKLERIPDEAWEDFEKAKKKIFKPVIPAPAKKKKKGN